MKIQYKISLLVFSILVFILIFVSIVRDNDEKRFKLFFESEREERESFLEKILVSKRRPLELFVYDYTYWDEFYNFVDHPSKSWTDVNIDAVMGKFGVNDVWVYKPDFTLVYHKSVSEDTTKWPISVDSIHGYIEKKWFSHFFILKNQSVMEIFTAPIQPTNDSERKTKPKGFFIVGKKWDEKYCEEIADLVDGRVLIIPQKHFFYEKIGDSVDVGLDLKSWNESSVAFLNVAYGLPEYKEIEHLVSFQKAVFFFIIVFIMAPLFIMLIFWIGRPLNRISQALLLNSELPLAKLRASNDEFGRIASMMSDFFSQKRQLENEVEYRKALEVNLKQSEREYRLLFENAHDMIMIIDETGSLLSTSESCTHLYGYTLEQFKKTNLEHVWPTFKSVDIRRLCHTDIGGYEFEHITSSGKKIWVETNFTEIIYKGRSAFLLIHRDISDRKAIGEMEISREILSQIENLVVLINAQGYILFVNRACEKTLGYSQPQLLGDGWYDLVYPNEDVKGDQIEFMKSIQEGHLSKTDMILEIPMKTQTGEYRHIEWHYTLNIDRSIISIGYDITERKKIKAVEEEIKIRRLRAATIAETQEDERRLMASELHDGLAQYLTAIRRQAELMTPEEFKKHQTSIINIAETAGMEARALAGRLTSPVLQQLGLGAALRRLLEDTGIRFEFQTFELKPRYDKNIEILLYRLSQEALQNVMKHAHAQLITLQLIDYEVKLVLTIEDDGIGFDKDGKSGMGLANMIDRVEFLGGIINIDSMPDHGTAIMCEIPIKNMCEIPIKNMCEIPIKKNN